MTTKDEERTILLGNKIATQLTPSNESMKAIRLLREELRTTLAEVRQESYKRGYIKGGIDEQMSS